MASLIDDLRELSSKKEISGIEEEKEFIKSKLLEHAKDGEKSLVVDGIKFPHELKVHFKAQGLEVSIYREYDHYHQQTMPTGRMRFEW